MNQRTHELKIQPRFFEPVMRGEKTFEIRKNDRDYKKGDIIILREWSDIMNNYTGRQLKRKITYIYKGSGQFGLAPGYAIIALGFCEE